MCSSGLRLRLSSLSSIALVALTRDLRHPDRDSLDILLLEMEDDDDDDDELGVVSEADLFLPAFI